MTKRLHQTIQIQSDLPTIEKNQFKEQHLQVISMYRHWFVYSYPIELRPGDGHVAVVLRVIAGAAEGFLSEEDEILLGQTSI